MQNITPISNKENAIITTASFVLVAAWVMFAYFFFNVGLI
jgi:hypothetical protein